MGELPSGDEGRFWEGKAGRGDLLRGGTAEAGLGHLWKAGPALKPVEVQEVHPDGCRPGGCCGRRWCGQQAGSGKIGWFPENARLAQPHSLSIRSI